METKINIAAILKDKPQGTKLYDWLHNIDVELDTISTTDTETVVWCTNETNNNTTCHRGYSEFGTERGYPDGLQILFPSKQMQDWSKFAWKKGDVLQISDIGFCTFETWASDDYTTFKGKYGVGLGKNIHHDYISKKDLTTSMWYKVEDKSLIKDYLDTVEKRLGGKLNLETLEIEQPKREFKDGDIVTLKIPNLKKNIRIFKEVVNKKMHENHYYVGFNFDDDGRPIQIFKDYYAYTDNDRPATDSEKQQLFSALAKEGKRWNPDTKQIEDLPKKCEFKPMDWCLMRDVDEVEYRGFVTSEWVLCQFSHYLEGYKFVAVGGNWFGECIPYNEETAHLLGTTDEWKGGEG